MIKGLFSSQATNRQIDLKADSTTHHPHQHLSLDTTITSSLLPTYLATQSTSPTAVHLLKAARKIGKHAKDCDAIGRTFLPFTSDTLGGIGPPQFVEWLKSVYAAYDRANRAEGGDGSDGRFALDTLLAELLAVLVRDNVRMIDRLTINDRP